MHKFSPPVLTQTLNLNPDVVRKHEPAYCYTRYSDEELQRESSTEQQVLACRESAAKKGHYIDDSAVFSDSGVQGWKEDRPALQQMMELIRTGTVRMTDLYIFDTARASRNMEFALKLQKFFDFHKVRVHYVSNGMVSGNAGFKIQHTILALMDEQFSQTLGQNVKRGQVNQFENGYYAMSRVYGYDHVVEVDPVHADSFDRRHRIGVRTAINPAQAEVVRLIFSMYRSGSGYGAIARHLNQESLKSPRRPTKGNVRRWGISSIRTIINNDRYTGVVRYGKVESRRDPESSKVKHHTRPEEEWRVYHDENLRIIKDEEFEAAQKVRETRDTLGSQRKAAGLARANGIYPWSGLLKCGECGGGMNIHQPNTYMCSTANDRGPCQNRLKLNRGSFEKQMLEFLVRCVRQACFFDQTVDALMAEVLLQQEESKRVAALQAANRDSGRAKLLDVNEQISNLVYALSRSPHSEAIDRRLRELEAEKKLLMESLQEREASTDPVSDRADIAEYLSCALENLAEILSSDPRTCREEIRARVDQLVLTPTTFENHAAFEISGDLRLFESASAKMLCSNAHSTAKHFCPVLNLSGLKVKVDTRGFVLRIADLRAGLQAQDEGFLMAA